jgi:NAD(P)-dependent dehydrogenase (short-subunit alcohol dehydrogenase family)
VLVNEAAITGGMPQEPTRVDPDIVGRVMDTNVLGVLRVTNAVLPLLRRDRSDLGGVRGVEDLPERRRRAVREGAGGHADPGQRGLPGSRRDRPQRFRGYRTPEQGAAIAIRLATLPGDGPTAASSTTTGRCRGDP